MENETEAIRQQLQEKRDQADAIRSTMSSFTDNSQVFLRKIPNDFRDVHKVYDFIKRNSGRFVGEVLGPGIFLLSFELFTDFVVRYADMINC